MTLVTDITATTEMRFQKFIFPVVVWLACLVGLPQFEFLGKKDVILPAQDFRTQWISSSKGSFYFLFKISLELLIVSKLFLRRNEPKEELKEQSFSLFIPYGFGQNAENALKYNILSFRACLKLCSNLWLPSQFCHKWWKNMGNIEKQTIITTVTKIN